MNLHNALINSKKIVIIYFYSDECITISNIVDRLVFSNTNLLIHKYNVDDNINKHMINKLDVKCYPSFFIYKHGELIDEIIGTMDKLENILNLYINI